MTLLLRRFFLFVLFLAPMGAQAGEPVTLHPAIEVTAAHIRLGDLFSGVPESLDRAIAQAPAPGKSVTYDARVLAHLANQYRLEWQPDNALVTSVITRAATRITEAMVRDSVMGKLTGPESTYGIKGQVDLDLDTRINDICLPADRPALFALNNFDYDATTRRFRADLRAETGSAPIMMTLSGRANVKREVPVLSKRIEAGAMIAATDLDWAVLPEEKLAQDTVTSADQLIGHALKRDGLPGSPILARDIIPPRLVNRGSLVLLKVETPMMLVTAQGRALQDGAAGEVIRVTNTQSNRVVEGTIESAGVVRIKIPDQIVVAHK